MGARLVRLNELIKRELSEVLHTRYQSETVALTVSGVDVSPDLRYARVFYSVLGDEVVSREAEHFFRENSSELRRLLGRRVVTKYLPRLDFIEDDGLVRGAELNQIMDEMGLVGEGDGPLEPPPEP